LFSVLSKYRNQISLKRLQYEMIGIFFVNQYYDSPPSPLRVLDFKFNN
jgi:hypothetical protein